ncbi:hypothetical protein D3C71_1892350 [compost metagenome]
MIQTDAIAANGIDLRINAIVHFQGTLRQLALMTDGLAVFLGIAHFKIGASGFQHAFIANLATGFTVERSFIQYHYGFFTGVDLIDRLTVAEQRDHG